MITYTNKCFDLSVTLFPIHKSGNIQERIKTLDSKVRKKQNQLEENELIINHLVTVINRSEPVSQQMLRDRLN